MAKLSIIIPTYNVEKYIRKCLDSLVNQTSKDFIAYVINDGSPANEFEIANEYAASYEFIRSLKKENGGYGSVLDMAFKLVETDYVLICDPDDYLRQDAVETLMKLMEETEADLVIGAKYLVYSDNQEEVYDFSYNPQWVKLMSGQAVSRQDEVFKDFYFADPSPHAKIYRTEQVKTIRFPLKVSFTDNLLFYLALNQAQKVVYTEEALAYYLIDRAGNTSTDVKPQVMDYWFTVFNEIMLQSSELKSVPDIFYYRMFESFKFVFNMIDRVKADEAVLSDKLHQSYTMLEQLKPYRMQLETYYLIYAKAAGRERENDLKLIRNLEDKAQFERLVRRKLNRIKYGTGLKGKIINLIKG